MKNYFEVILMTVIAFVCAVFVYPFLHEGGHVLAAFLLGGKCVEFNLLPPQYTVFDAAGAGSAEIAAIGLSGIVFPFLISFIPWGKNFYVWFARFVLRGITVLSLIIAVSTVVLRRFGITAQNDDITEILRFWNGGTVWLITLFPALCIIMIILIVRDEPFRKIKYQLLG